MALMHLKMRHKGSAKYSKIKTKVVENYHTSDLLLYIYCTAHSTIYTTSSVLYIYSIPDKLRHEKNMRANGIANSSHHYKKKTCDGLALYIMAQTADSVGFVDCAESFWQRGWLDTYIATHLYIQNICSVETA